MTVHAEGATRLESVAIELPFDFYRVPGTGRRLQSHPFSLPLLGNGHGSLANRAEDPVPDPLLAAAFGILLARYSGQSSILLHLSGWSWNGERRFAQPIAFAIDEGTTCRDVLEQIGDLSSVEAAIWDRTVFDSPQEAAGGQAALAWLQAGSDGEGSELRNALGVVERTMSAASDADLTLVVGPGGEAAFVFDASLFRQSSVERFAGHLEMLLSTVTMNLDARVSDLPLLLPAEQSWLESVCDGRVQAMPSLLAHELVERQAATFPNATAVRFRDQSLSYGELNRRANQLARHLAERGVGAGSAVLVCVEPAFDIVLALLGILKAGAVYVPLDPTYPAARIRAILEDTRPALIITQSHLEAQFEREFAGAIVLVLGDGRASEDGLASENPATRIRADQPAYVYYTSGTTGSPKGVVGHHANLLHYVQSALRRYELGSHDVMPAIARFSFSISMFELLAPLAAGGTLLILEREHILDPARLSETLAEVTIFHAGPSLLRGLVAYIQRHYPNSALFSGVRHASSGGDMVPPELLEAMKDIFPNAELFVIYGCSEISCMGCTYPVPRDRRITTTYVGRPFDNVVVRVLDGAGRVLPAGIVGEIHFAGEGVTQGYLNRAELTAERFVVLGGRRFYRTGDRGRLSEDGWLEILGRNDFQVKLRGMRVELGEVEHQLRRAPWVRDAVAVAREGRDQDKVLVAYVVTERANGAPLEKAARISAIRQHLLDHLPDYMVPAAYVELDALPLNHNLKVDRRALPELLEADRRAASGPSLREPETPTERVLAALWQKLLGVRRVGLDDNFFELGGHSLLAVQFSLEVEAALGIKLHGMAILREPLEVLAALCDRRLGKPSAKRETWAPPRADPLEIFHFGDGQSLYGVLHGGSGAATEAALICGPVGQEYVRARFVLTKLAKQLARAGVPTLMFDYFGCGDSLGDSGDADLARWRADIAHAHEELRRRTNGARITAVGVRLGALLLCQAARRLGVSKLVLWDPVDDGAAYASDLAQMQRQYLRSIGQLRFGKWPRLRLRDKELLGTSYSRAALRDLRAFSLAPLLAEQRAPIRWLATQPPAGELASVHGLCPRDGNRVQRLDFDCGWRDVARLEDVIPDVHLSDELRAMVMEE